MWKRVPSSRIYTRPQWGPNKWCWLWSNNVFTILSKLSCEDSFYHLSHSEETLLFPTDTTSGNGAFFSGNGNGSATGSPNSPPGSCNGSNGIVATPVGGAAGINNANNVHNVNQVENMQQQQQQQIIQTYQVSACSYQMYVPESKTGVVNFHSL